MFLFLPEKEKQQFIGKVVGFNLCQLLLTENVAGNKNLTNEAAGCLRCEVDSLGSVPFKFVCLFVVVVIVFLFFSNFSAKNISSRLIRGILLS